VSAHGGIWFPDGRPIQKPLLDLIRYRLDSQGPDGGSAWEEPGVAMVHRGFHTGMLDRFEHQPSVCSDCAITWSGRLDNRSELIRQLDAEHIDDQTPDVAIVMASWLRWREECFLRFVGDWTIALYDRPAKSLYLVRDYVGARPLLYYKSASVCLWSSEIGAVADLVMNVTGNKPPLNEDFLASFLAFHPEKHITPFDWIHSVPPGHFVILRHSSAAIRRYWRIDESRVIRYAKDADYEEHFRALFRDAVRCRLRTDHLVFSQLSGGLDSSAIVCMADEILRTEKTAATDLRTISFLFDRAGETDEREFSALIKQKTRRLGHDLFEDLHPARFPDPEEIPCAYPSVAALLSGIEEAQWAVMNRDGGRVLLSGEAGDEMLGNIEVPDSMLADLIWDGSLTGLHSALGRWSSALAVPYYRLLWRAASFTAKHRSGRITGAGAELGPWLHPRYVELMNLRVRAKGLPDPFALSRPSARDRSESFETATANISQCWSRPGRPVDRTYPFLHRPLIEFLQAIPPSQILRPGERRSLMRRSIRHLLPDRIRNRKTKRNWDGVYCRALIRDWERIRRFFEKQMFIADRGYVVKSRFLASIQSARHGAERVTYPLWKAIYLELWLRAYEHMFGTGNTAAAPVSCRYEISK
jgi:asparagine synthase (glutamine-hydrolysing)